MSGVTVFLSIIAVAAAVIIWWLWREWRSTGPGAAESNVARMKREYQKLTGLRGAAAYDSLERKLERMMKQHPGQSMEFYLHGIIEELKRDKR